MECAEVGELGDYYHSTKYSVPWNHTAFMRREITVHNEYEGEIRHYNIVQASGGMETNPYRPYNS
jgi:hypothetical protein